MAYSHCTGMGETLQEMGLGLMGHKKGKYQFHCFQWRIQDFPNGGRQPPRWRRQPIILRNFSRKLHENERVWTWGAHVPGAHLRSANGFLLCWSDLAPMQCEWAIRWIIPLSPWHPLDSRIDLRNASGASKTSQAGEGDQPPKESVKLLFGKFFPQKCMTMNWTGPCRYLFCSKTVR